ICADAVSEAISFDSGENVLSFRPSSGDAISEIISFDSGEKVLSFRPSYGENHQSKAVPPEDDGGFLLTSCRLALLEDSCG
ncbi:unnamed protein product, partial [Protopolystoma xenopodis]